MKRIFCLLLVLLCSRGYAQLNVDLLHQLVEHSKQEYTLQTAARDKQAVASVNEQINAGGAAELKSRYQQLHKRFTTLGTALELLSSGMESMPLLTEISKQQQRIVGIATADPLLLPLAVEAERELAGRAVQLARYVTGLFLSSGDLNQMKASDRRLLYSHVLQELKRIAAAVKVLADTLAYRSGIHGSVGNPFSGFRNQDKQIATGILGRLEALKP